MEEASRNHKIAAQLKGLESVLSSKFLRYDYRKCPINRNTIKSSAEEIIKKFKGYIPIEVKKVLNQYNDIDLIDDLELIERFVNEIRKSLG